MKKKECFGNAVFLRFWVSKSTLIEKGGNGVAKIEPNKPLNGGKAGVRHRNRRIKRKLETFLYLLPAITIFLVFIVWPILYNLQLSFFSWNMVSTKQFIGLDNYIGLFTDKDFIKALGNTVLYVLFMMIFCFVMPYFFSFVLGQLVKKGQQLYRAIMFFPSLLSLAVAATVFRWIFNAVNGPATLLLNMMGMEAPKWLAQSGWVIFVLSLVTGWRCFGYNLVIFLAAIIEIPKDLIEAAKLENASNWTIFWKIVIPLTSSTALYVFVVSFVFGLQYVFTPIHMLTAGGPNQASTNLVYIIYQYGFSFFQSGRAAAVAVVSLVLFLLVVALQKRLERNVHYEN